MKSFKLMGFCLILIGALLSGCSDFHVVKPDNFLMPAAEVTPLPLVVGIRVIDQPIMNLRVPHLYSRRGTRGFSDMELGPTFASSLTSSNLFKSVLYQPRQNDKVDLMIDFSSKGRFVADEAAWIKAYFTGFFLWLPAPIIEYEHHYKTSAKVRLASQKGQQFKAYEASSDIQVLMKIQAPAMEVEDQAVEAATNDLINQLVMQLQKDKAYLSGLGAETR